MVLGRSLPAARVPQAAGKYARQSVCVIVCAPKGFVCASAAGSRKARLLSASERERESVRTDGRRSVEQPIKRCLCYFVSFQLLYLLDLQALKQGRDDDCLLDGEGGRQGKTWPQVRIRMSKSRSRVARWRLPRWGIHYWDQALHQRAGRCTDNIPLTGFV